MRTRNRTVGLVWLHQPPEVDSRVLGTDDAFVLVHVDRMLEINTDDPDALAVLADGLREAADRLYDAQQVAS